MKRQGQRAGLLALVVVVFATALLRLARASRPATSPVQPLPLALPATQPLKLAQTVRRQAPRAGFLALVALLATSVIGSAYALWFEDMRFNSVVATGTIDATLTCDSIEASDEVKTGAAAVGAHAYKISVTGANPGDTFQCTLTIKNTGTTAWHLEDELLKVLPPGARAYTATCEGYPDQCTAGEPSPELTRGIARTSGGDAKPLHVSLGDLRGCQVHAGQTLTTTLYVGVNKGATPEAIYELDLELKVNQWNESKWDACGDRRTASPAGSREDA